MSTPRRDMAEFHTYRSEKAPDQWTAKITYGPDPRFLDMGSTDNPLPSVRCTAIAQGGTPSAALDAAVEALKDAVAAFVVEVRR